MRLLGLIIAYHAAVAALRRTRSIADGMALRHARRELARFYGVEPMHLARPPQPARAASICERWSDTLRMLQASEGRVYSAPMGDA